MPDAEPPPRRADLFYVLPLPIRWVDGHLHFDKQSRASVYRLLASFDTMIMGVPVMEEAEVAKNPIYVWEEADDLLDRIQFVPLPKGSVVDFLKNYRATVRTLRRCIEAADRLNFSIGGAGGLHNDWGQVAAEEAIKMGRRFSLQNDWNSFGVFETQAQQAKGLAATPRRWKLKLKAWLVKLWQGRLVSRCDLMICNGRDVQLAYMPFCRSPEIAYKINDFQIDPDKILPPDRVEAKCEAVQSRPELRVVYAGRVVAMKGPLQWVRAIHEARRLGAQVKATWLGDGPLLEEMRAEVQKSGLGDVVELPGFVSDRDAVIDALRAGDVLMFTHLEPESPRVLIESLISATPIVGYFRHYPEDLIAAHEGGVLTPIGDPKALGAAIAALAADRPKVADLIRRASRDGSRFDGDVMIRQRCEKMKEMVRPAFAPGPPEPSPRPA